MEDGEILKKLDKIAKEMFPKELIGLIIENKIISPSFNPKRDVNSDSLDDYEMLYKIEEEFKISIEESDPRFRELETAQELIDYLKNNYTLS